VYELQAMAACGRRGDTDNKELKKRRIKTGTDALELHARSDMSVDRASARHAD